MAGPGGPGERKYLPEYSKERGNTIMFLRNIPRDLKAQFRAACVRRELSMQQVIRKLMRRFINMDSSVNLKDITPNKRRVKFAHEKGSRRDREEDR